MLALLLLVTTTAAAPPVFVSLEDSGEVAVIDSARNEVVARIPVGRRPRGLRLSPDGKRLYVAVSGSPKGGPGVDESRLPPPDRSKDGIAEVDLASGRVVRTLPSGDDPESFDLTPDGRWMFVSNEDAGRTSVLDLHSGKVVAQVPVGGEPEGVTTRPDGRVVYVTSEAEHAIAVLDARRRTKLASVPVCQRPRSVVFTRDGALAFVSCELGGAVAVLDARAHKVLGEVKLEGGALPMGLALSPDGRTLWVSTGRAGGVAQVDVAGRKLVRTTTDVGRRPWGIAATRDGRTLYTANGPGNDVSAIDAASGQVRTRIAVGGTPWGVAIRP